MLLTVLLFEFEVDLLLAPKANPDAPEKFALSPDEMVLSVMSEALKDKKMLFSSAKKSCAHWNKGKK